MLTLVAVVLAFTVVPSPWNVVAVLSAATVDVVQTAVFVRWSRRRSAAIGAETMVGRTAVAVTVLSPRGQVKLDGELWEARASSVVEPGEEVTIARVEGLVLDVEAS